MFKHLTLVWLGLFLLTAPAKPQCQTQVVSSTAFYQLFTGYNALPNSAAGQPPTVSAKEPHKLLSTATDRKVILFYGISAGLLALLLGVGLANCLLYLYNRNMPAYLFYGLFLLSLWGLFGLAFDAFAPLGSLLPDSLHTRPVRLLLMAAALLALVKSMGSALQWKENLPGVYRSIPYLAGTAMGYVVVDVVLWSVAPALAGHLWSVVQIAFITVGSLSVYALFWHYRWRASYMSLGVATLVFSCAAASIAHIWPLYFFDGWPTALYPYFIGLPLQMLLFTLGFSRLKNRAEDALPVNAARVQETEVPGVSDELRQLSSPVSPADQALLNQLDEQIEAHLDDRSYDVNTMAASTGKSRASFHEWFKQATGTTPAKYLTALRIKMAHRLLINTDYTVEAIAQRTGFNDGAYLAKKFKQHYGIRPSEARKQAAV